MNHEKSRRKHSSKLTHEKIGSAVLSQRLSLAYLHDIFVKDHLGKVFYVFTINEGYQETAFDDLAHSQLGRLN